ncbi:MAG: MFS transporter [Bacteroidota bacterium]
MAGPSLRTILLSTFLGLAALYSPQPLLPFFARLLAVSEADAATLVSWSLLAMSIGPLGVGYLLMRLGTKKVYIGCLIGLAVTTVAFAAIDHIMFMKVVRFAQGGLIAGLLASTMTYIAQVATNMREVMAYYVGASVLGGLGGRITAGMIAEHFNWQYFFAGLGLLFVYCALRAKDLKAPPVSAGVTRKPVSLWKVFGDRYVRRQYVVIMLAFFCPTAVLNFAPFRLEQLDETLGASIISLFYLGFIAGFFVSINAPRIADFAGGTVQAIWLGMGMVCIGLLIGLLPSIVAIFIAITLVTSGFFLQHACMVSLLNTYAGPYAGSVNSLYVSIYYLGGAAGAYLPGLIFLNAGWALYTGLLLAVVGISFAVSFTTRPAGGAFLKFS